ncbi:MAG TPA: hypothetical protein VNE39_23495 [Planctomycetota bacterium]|nr:hypothetical protein [Planctomycetota bacterium]
MKLDRPTLVRYAWRAALIAALAVGILAFGYRHGRAWLSPRAMPSPGPARVQAAIPFEALAGSTLLRSHECVFNGEKATFAQFRSNVSARSVVEQFEERFGKPTDQAPPTRGTMMHVAARSYAAAGAVDSEGCTVGIVAYEDPKTGGSVYFVGRSKPGDPKGWRHGDVPGDEVPGIPRPPQARRVFCVDGLGGIPSRLLVYEGAGSLDDAAQVFADEMPKAGWTRNSDAENVVQTQLPGKFLSFLQGTRRAMVYIERDPGTSKVRTAVAYSVKDWLPPDRGL